jgi:dephospho-CoA kinase
MFLVGLTGGIASGKSSVAKLLRAAGAETIDADEVAREVVEPGTTGLAQIVEAFGEEILKSDGSLSREKLAALIFADGNLRTKLESILHPLIRARTMQHISQSAKNIVVYQVPLLVEAKVDYPFDMIVTVEAGVENQLGRLMASRGLSLDEAKARIAAQATEEERIMASDYRIDTSGPKENLEAQVAKLWQHIESEAKGVNADGAN